ncbi:MAG: polymerase subunit sigma-70 [Rariglobus sp.]|jgi:RNA polymerase sigma-70 factor (ECF subfamily)|nr:polymerase subunit sigma-70 [Rariglobus sp.]
MSSSFATTRWTVVLDAARHGETDTTSAGRALSTLCQTYWPPLYAHARRRGLAPADAEDAVQGFFARLLRLESLADAKRERGRFRAFLLGSFNHYLADLHDHARAEKRGAHLLPALDTAATEAALASAACANLAPDRAFDRTWALALLNTVTARLRTEHANPEHFDALLPCLAGRTAGSPHADLAAKLGLTEPAVRVALHRLRQRYRHFLREEVAQTVARPEDVDAELRHLLAALTP